VFLPHAVFDVAQLFEYWFIRFVLGSQRVGNVGMGSACCGKEPADHRRRSHLQPEPATISPSTSFVDVNFELRPTAAEERRHTPTVVPTVLGVRPRRSRQPSPSSSIDTVRTHQNVVRDHSLLNSTHSVSWHHLGALRSSARVDEGPSHRRNTQAPSALPSSINPHSIPIGDVVEQP
jgi:hypothetical protein